MGAKCITPKPEKTGTEFTEKNLPFLCELCALCGGNAFDPGLIWHREQRSYSSVFSKKKPRQYRGKGKPVITGISSAFVVCSGGVFFLDAEPGGIECRQKQQGQCRCHDQAAHDGYRHGAEENAA
jgi:hypothetical protein